MPINIDEDNLKQGVLGLVVGLVEVIQELLELQAIKRIEGGRLSDEDIERLGNSLSDLKEALDKIKQDNDLHDAVESVRGGLDEIAHEMLDKFVIPVCENGKT